jgi:signal transduction histidine kinase
MSGQTSLAVRRHRSSVLVKVVGALVVALAVSTAVTAVVASRLTGAALNDQARELALGHLSVLQEAYSAREGELVEKLRDMAERLTAQGLLEPQRRPDLIAELGRSQGNLNLDMLRVLDATGRDLVPPVGAGTVLQAPTGAAPERLTVEPASRLLPTVGDSFVQAVPVPLNTSRERLILIGGYEFSDKFAYLMRKQIGSLDDVVLVGGGRVAGTTLADPPRLPPGLDPDTRALPQSPKVLRVSGVSTLVAYAPVSRSPTDPTGGALGVVLANPTATLHRSLSQTRLVSSALLALVALGLGWLLFRALVRPLVTLADTAGRIAAGDPDASFAAPGNDEVALLAGSLEAMRHELGARLEVIAAQAGELRESSQRIVAAQDLERHRLARDLHDGLQQQLVVLRMQVGMLEDGIGVGDATEPAEEFAKLGRQLDGVIEQLREVTHNLYPSILLDRGLAAALHSYVGRLPLSARLTCEPPGFPRLDPALESAAYFLLCEAVTNALKHSGATTIELSLKLDDDWLTVCIADDGRGFEVGDGHRHGGLLHMEDRVRSFGGRLQITSTLGAGSRVVAAFPHRPLIEAGTVSPRSAEERTAPPPPGG